MKDLKREEGKAGGNVRVDDAMLIIIINDSRGKNREMKAYQGRGRRRVTDWEQGEKEKRGKHRRRVNNKWNRATGCVGEKFILENAELVLLSTNRNRNKNM